MESGNNGTSDINISGISHLCRDFWQLDLQRVELDLRLAGMSEDDRGRDLIWLDLESILRQIAAVTAQLAAANSLDATDLSAKAIVLVSLLRSGKSEQPLLIPETLALVVSVVNEVARLND